MIDHRFMQNGTVHQGVAVISTSANNIPEVKWTEPPQEKQKESKRIQVTDNMTTVDRMVLFAGEVGGTAVLVFLGCMGCVTGIASGGIIPHEQISFTFGLAVMVAVQVFGHISGSHINPIVTVAALTLGNISLIQVPIYFAGQLVGALAGFGLLNIVTPSKFLGNELIQVNNVTVKTLGVCSPALHPDVTPFQGFFVEFLITMILALVCCGVWDYRNHDKHDSVSIRFGFTIAVLAMAAGPYTGANMNPVRSLAPALFNGDWKDHWVYWLGPLLGAFIGALAYRILFNKVAPPKPETGETIPLNDNNKA
ncbi:aquaporin AQPAe.a-like isoform X2 [Rhynchophorus ferrugineus]